MSINHVSSSEHTKNQQDYTRETRISILGSMPPRSLQVVEGCLKIRFTVRRADFVLQLCKNVKEETFKKGTTICRVFGSDDFAGLHDDASSAEQFQNCCLTVFLHIVYLRHSLNELVEECLVLGSWLG
jgi:hypothetical protein